MAGCAHLSSNWRSTPKTTSSTRAQHDLPDDNVQPTNVLRGEDDPQTLAAIDEGRRLYVGNLSYRAKTEDVENLFETEDYKIVHINMSIDPFTSRNPSYCFVELATRSQAERAMREVTGKSMVGRPVKIGPCVPKTRSLATQGGNGIYPLRQAHKPVFDRWTRTDAKEHWHKYNDQGRRLFVGGLPEMQDHYRVNAGIRELFGGFSLEAVSKVIIPKIPLLGDQQRRNHRYLFVDFPSAEEANRAQKATDGRYAWGVRVRVKMADPVGSWKTHEREEWDEEQQP